MLPPLVLKGSTRVRALERTVRHERLDLARARRSPSRRGHQHRAGEVLVELRHVDVGGPHAGALPEGLADVS